MNSTDQIIQCNVLEGIPLPDKSVHCVVTSPPYWGLRDYGVAGQLGLEKTPEEFIERMVGVFRHVWRVLRDDGTCWLNMGGSYNNATPGGRDPERWPKQSRNDHKPHQKPLAAGLKVKDLCMMPARLAIALQQPFYTGKIKNELDRVWLAAMVDGEGCMFIHKRKKGQSNGQGYFRKNDSFGAGLEVANCHQSIVQRCLDITGMGSICRVERETKTRKRNMPLFRWNMRSNQCRDIVREIYPYLVGKQHEARLLLGCPSSGVEAEKAHASLMALHNGREASIDFPAPKPCTEQGWYIRNDIIWHKLNPMPESTKDRCTKSHEHLFLLTKKPKYFYDADAVREDVTGNAHDRGTGVNPKAVIGTGVGYNRASKVDQTDNRNNRPRVKQNESFSAAVTQLVSSRNKRDVWTIPTQACDYDYCLTCHKLFTGKERGKIVRKDDSRLCPQCKEDNWVEHFATFPEKLVQPCIKAGTSEKGCCPECGSPWVRVVEKDRQPTRAGLSQKTEDYNYDTQRHCTTSTTIGWKPTCEHGLDPIPCTVYDPFGGSMTTCLVAYKLNRHYKATELSPEYIEMGEKRLAAEKDKFSLLEAPCPKAE